jgi:hypothetical protein
VIEDVGLWMRYNLVFQCIGPPGRRPPAGYREPARSWWHHRGRRNRADAFVFASSVLPAPNPVTHIADYSAAQGDVIDNVGGARAAPATPDILDAALVRIVEDANDMYATLQANADGSGGEVLGQRFRILCATARNTRRDEATGASG